MVLGLLTAGMVVGATAAFVWLLAGGSLGVAFVIYSFVAMTSALGVALLRFWLSERRQRAAFAASEAVRPDE